MNGSMLEKIVSCPRVPTLPAVAMQVLEATRSDDIDFREVASIIEKDQGIAGKVLRTVNSSYYGLSKPCGTIHQAMVYLGVNSVRTLVLGFALIDSVSKGGGSERFDFMTYWKRGIYTAVAARELAKLQKAIDPDEAFLGGIMQDIGMIAMNRHFQIEYGAVLDLAGSDHASLSRIELEALQIDHQRISAEMLERWKLPEHLVIAIRHHHDPQRAAMHCDFVHTIALANEIAAALMHQAKTTSLRAVARHAAAWFEINDRQVRQLLQTVREASHDLASLFRVDIVGGVDVDAMLMQAEQQLVESQVAADRERIQLRQNNEKLTQQNLMDPLTGAANRKRFDSDLEAAFSEAQQNDGAVALVFCDADHFKMLNDTHGHQAGDAVLVAMAARLKELVGLKGIVARYGGEEFGIVLPDCGRLEAATIAESIRRGIESSRIALPDLPDAPAALSVTVSVGVAAWEPEVAETISRPDLLLRVADQAVYAAKQSGRNCVRIFTPAARKPHQLAA